MTDDMEEAIQQKLDSEDDQQLWQVILNELLSELDAHDRVKVEIGRCSHWIRPQKPRWSADGVRFAIPTGYGGHGLSFSSLPLFDWSLVLEWTGHKWTETSDKSAERVWRVAVPSRTHRHKCAAVHTTWIPGGKDKIRFYGFRKGTDGWRLIGVSRRLEEATHDERMTRIRERERVEARRLQRRNKSRIDA